MFNKWLKIFVAKQQLMTVLDTEGGDHAINGFPDGDAFFSEGAIIICCGKGVLLS
jgi:hypothetical protein